MMFIFQYLKVSIPLVLDFICDVLASAAVVDAVNDFEGAW